jgi:hypothetical protein
MARELRYEFSASAEPPEPTKTSTLYTGQIPYPVGGGYYAVKAYEDGNTSGVARKGFERDWTPANTTTALWLDSNDLTTITKDGSNLVSQWNDKSGNSRNATASGTARPTWSSGKITFDGSNDFMSIPQFNINCPTSIFIVAKVNTLSGDRTIINQQYTTDKLKPYQHYINSSGRLIDWRTGGYAQGVVANNIFQVCEIQSATNIVDYWLNANAGTRGTGANSYAESIPLYIGKAQSFGTIGWMSGEICEIILCTSATDTTTRQKFEGYLAWKWGNALVTALPSDHPYKSAPPTI